MADRQQAPRRHDDFLERSRYLIERAIRRRWNDGLITKDPDGVFTGFLGAEHIERLLKPQVTSPEEAENVVATYDYPPETPLGAMIARLGLSPSEADLIGILLACEIDPIAARLVSFLGGNQAQFTLTLDLIFEIVHRERSPHRSQAAAMLHRDLSPHRLLRRLRYLTVDGSDQRVALAQGIRMHQRVAAWLLGQTDLDADLTARGTLYPPMIPSGECDPEAIKVAMAALQAGGRLLIVEGPAQSGRELLVRFAAASLGRPLLVVSGRGLGADRIVAAFREASLHGALLAFRETEEAIEGEGLLRMRECLDVFDSSVALIGAGKAVPTVSGLRRNTVVTVGVPPHSEREQLWRNNLGPEHALSDDDVRQVAALYNLGTGGIQSASNAAREMATFGNKPLDRGCIAHSVRQLFDADLSAIATRVEVTQTWDDLVLPDDLAESVIDILNRIRFRTDVLGRWGFARKLGKGLGLTVLFSGEPGTGKSMAAGLIANELHLDLYIIDLSRVTSKWLGETEKNLARAFDAAEAGHVLLLFDEADSILGKRSGDIKSSNDRNANLETNFILARIEQFGGIAFFTTNLPSAIDPAVSRRMSCHVNFPFPDRLTRSEMWRRMIPDEAPIEGDIDFEALADRFELSGGFIRNIVLRAAYVAVRDGKGISQDLLEHAAEMEYRERGSLLIGGRLV